MSASSPSASRRLSRQILVRVLFFGVFIMVVATVAAYNQVYEQSTTENLASLRQYMEQRRLVVNRVFVEASERMAIFRDAYMDMYLSDVDYGDEAFSKLYFVDKDGATRMKEKYYQGVVDAWQGNSAGVSSFIGNNQPVDSPDLKRRLMIANVLVRRFGPAWAPIGILHATFPENMLTIYSPEDPWGLNARPDLPMNELGTIKATLQSENPERDPVWTGLYYDATADKWTITLEVPVDHEGRHLVNPSMDVRLESIMRGLEAETPEGTYSFIVSRDGRLVAHPGALREELREKGDLSLEELGDPDLSRMYERLVAQAGGPEQAVAVVEDKEGGNYLLASALSGPDWWYVIVYPEKLIAAEAHKASQIVLLFGVLLFLLYYVVVYVVIQRQVKAPLQKLQKAVGMVAGGKYDEVVQSPHLLPVEQRNEIGQLAGMFLDMSREVSDVHTNLQHIVQSRTSELEEANAKLRELSLLDGLTGIHNRRSFDRDIAAVFLQARDGVDSFSLLMADVDRFKDYNDAHGHTAGDEVLRRIADLIAGSIRKEDRVYRYGGEEIAVIFNNADEESARQTGERIVRAVREAGIAHDGSEHGVITISAGLVPFDPDFANVTAMIDAADASLYQAKAGGRNNLCVQCRPQSGGVTRG